MSIPPSEFAAITHFVPKKKRILLCGIYRRTSNIQFLFEGKLFISPCRWDNFFNIAIAGPPSGPLCPLLWWPMPTQPLSISENLLGVSEGIFVVSKLDAALQRTLVEAPAPCRSAFWVAMWSCSAAGKNEEVTIDNRRSFVVNDHRMRQNCGGVCRGWAGLVADGSSWRKRARWSAADGLETLLGTCDIHDCMSHFPAPSEPE